jgi:hypothetical protein
MIKKFKKLNLNFGDQKLMINFFGSDQFFQVVTMTFWSLDQSLLEFLFFQIDQVNYMGFFLLKDMYFWLNVKGLNDNGYFLIGMSNLIISQIRHLIKLASALINNDTYYIQLIGLIR